ncbi:2-keto-3-deoxygluconate kinase [Cricetibacter osteomyelitidis]|uniref:2-dehydro-3-deoxygluconokinase n=1 Tax=Cricetibacter osteomyelitidis TaxID=1521931 RepID=A0A4V2T1S5_9PAST|nr:sugar kinase [Cricetibacter osteomyelitidis]TCP94673.1 2-keto-3-deoxygluconate kinase [Cricetibacter osteomyelitidis]
MKKIAILGECMIELNGEPFGEMKQSYGGDTLNTATYLSRISTPDQVEVYYISALGTDKLSQNMLGHWQADRINIDNVLLDPERQPGLYLIQLDKYGERTFLYWRNQSAARYLLQHDGYPKVLRNLRQMDMIYLSGISLAVLPEQDRSMLVKQLIELASQGVEIVFDSNYRPNLWRDQDETRQIYTALLPSVSLALVTFEDEQAIWQDENVQDVIRRLTSVGVKNVVVKQGKCGAFFRDYSGSEGQVATAQNIQVVDTTSAGDSFNAGFLNGYLQGKPLKHCCAQGNAVAAVVIQHKGAIIAESATAHFITEFNKGN